MPDINNHHINFHFDNSRGTVSLQSQDKREWGYLYAEFQIPGITPQFMWTVQEQSPKIITFSGQDTLSGIEQAGIVKVLDDTTLEIKLSIKVTQEIQLTSSYLGLSLSSEYWQFNNSFHTGVFPSWDIQDPAWSGTPEPEQGLTAGTGRSDFPIIQFQSVGHFSSIQVTVHPETHRAEFRSQRTDDVYGTIHLSPGTYTLAHVIIRLKAPEVIQLDSNIDLSNAHNIAILSTDGPGVAQFYATLIRQQYPDKQILLVMEEPVPIEVTPSKLNSFISYPRLDITPLSIKLPRLWKSLRQITTFHPQILLVTIDTVRDKPGKFLQLLAGFIPVSQKYMVDATGQSKRLPFFGWSISLYFTKKLFKIIKVLIKLCLIPIELIVFIIICIFLYLNEKQNQWQGNLHKSGESS